MKNIRCIKLKGTKYFFPNSWPIVQVCSSREAECLAVLSFRRNWLDSYGNPIVVYLKKNPNELNSSDMEEIELAVKQLFPELAQLFNRQIFVKYLSGEQFYIDRFGFFRSEEDYLAGTTLGVFSFREEPVLGSYKIQMRGPRKWKSKNKRRK